MGRLRPSRAVLILSSLGPYRSFAGFGVPVTSTPVSGWLHEHLLPVAAGRAGAQPDIDNPVALENGR